VPSVELHGNLGQNARTRNLAAFHGGAASTLVATDIAARGIHVDDVSLVVHADPPVEHKAYLHRSGRTARAGAAGTVITLMTDDQVRDVRTLARQAGIKPVTTRLQGSDHPILVELAPGERTLVTGGYAPAGAQDGEQRQSRGGGGGSRSGGRGRSRGRGRAGSGSQSGGQSGGQSRSRSAGRPGGGQRNGQGGGKRGAQRGSGGSGSHSAAGFSGRR